MLLTANFVAQAQPVGSIEAAAFACKTSLKCPYFDEFVRRSMTFKSALESEMHRARIKVNKAVFDGPASPVTPIFLDGRKALIGSVCEKHNCPHSLTYVSYWTNEGHLVSGIYTDDSGARHPFGGLSQSAVNAINASEWKVGQSFPERDVSPASSAKVENSGWYGADVNKTTCVPGPSPADRMRSIQGHGDRVQTTDLPDGGVEVGYDDQFAKFHYWTLYRSKSACISALPRLQAIPSKYE